MSAAATHAGRPAPSPIWLPRAPRVIVGLAVFYVGLITYFEIRLERENTSFDFAEIANIDWPVQLGSCSTATNPALTLPTPVTGMHACLQECTRRRFQCSAFSVRNNNGECLMFAKCGKTQEQPGWLTFARPMGSLLKHQAVERLPNAALQRNDLGLQVHGAHLVHKIKRKSMERQGTLLSDDLDCSYCPPQRLCEEQRLCRNGKCYEGLQLKVGTACQLGESFGQCNENGMCAMLQ